MDIPIVIIWTSLLLFLGESGVIFKSFFFFFSFFDEISLSKQNLLKWDAVNLMFTVLSLNVDQLCNTSKLKSDLCLLLSLHTVMF